MATTLVFLNSYKSLYCFLAKLFLQRNCPKYLYLEEILTQEHVFNSCAMHNGHFDNQSIRCNGQLKLNAFESVSYELSSLIWIIKILPHGPHNILNVNYCKKTYLMALLRTSTMHLSEAMK